MKEAPLFTVEDHLRVQQQIEARANELWREGWMLRPIGLERLAPGRARKFWGNSCSIMTRGNRLGESQAEGGCRSQSAEPKGHDPEAAPDQ